jgi:hypothetical protein
MKFWIGFIIVGLSVRTVMAIEEPYYSIIKQESPFEVRAYETYCVAETTVATSDFSEAGSIGFRRLFRYIQGDNQSQKKLPMTAPVGVEPPSSEKIPMTAPVGQSRNSEGYQVWFVMPKGSTLETLPKPTDPNVQIRCLEARHVATVRYSGGWAESRYEAKKSELLAWINKRNFDPIGPPVLCRYNSPFTLWFLRRNEVQIEINTKREK